MKKKKQSLKIDLQSLEVLQNKMKMKISRNKERAVFYTAARRGKKVFMMKI